MQDRYFELFCQPQSLLLQDFLDNAKTRIALIEGPYGAGKNECLFREARRAGVEILHYSPAAATENSLLVYLANNLTVKLGNARQQNTHLQNAHSQNAHSQNAHPQNATAKIIPRQPVPGKNRWRSWAIDTEVSVSELSGSEAFASGVARKPFSFQYLGQLHATMKSLLNEYDAVDGKLLVIVVSAVNALRSAEFNFLSELFVAEARRNSKLVFIADTDKTETALMTKLRMLSNQVSGQRIIFSNMSVADVETLMIASASNYDQEILQKLYRFSGGNFGKLKSLVGDAGQKSGLAACLKDNATTRHSVALRQLKRLDPLERKMCATLGILVGNPECKQVWASLYPDELRRETVVGLLKELDVLDASSDEFVFGLESASVLCSGLVTAVEAKYLNDRIATAMLRLREQGAPLAWGIIAGHVDAGFGAHSPYLSKESRLRILFGALEEECYCASFSVARQYAQKIALLLAGAGESVDTRLATEIYRLCAITAYMNADIAMMEKCIKEYLLLVAGDSKATLEGYRVLVEGYIVNNQLDEATEQIRHVLDKLNYQISVKSNPLRSALSVMTMLLSNAAHLNTNFFQHLVKRPESSDVGIFLIHLANVTYAKNDISLAAYAISVAIRFCMRNGLAEEAAYVLQFWACCVMGGFFHNIEKARQISDLAFRMESDHSRGAYSMRSRFVRDAFIGYHLDGLEENIRRLNEDFYNNFYEGDLPLASYAAHVCCFHAFDYNFSLPELLRRIDVYADQLRCYPVQNPDAWIKVLRQTVVNLLDAGSNGFDGDDFNLKRDLQVTRVRNNPALVFIAHHYCVVYGALTGNFDLAEHVREADRHIRHVEGTYGVVLSTTINAYVVFQRAQRGLCPMTEAQVYLRTAIKSLKRGYLQGSRVCYGKLQFLEALFARVSGKDSWNHLLQTSLQTARENGNLMDWLLALMASMQFSSAGERAALREQALDVCRMWNAPRVARYIDELAEGHGFDKTILPDASEVSGTAPLMH